MLQYLPSLLSNNPQTTVLSVVIPGAVRRDVTPWGYEHNTSVIIIAVYQFDTYSV